MAMSRRGKLDEGASVSRFLLRGELSRTGDSKPIAERKLHTMTSIGAYMRNSRKYRAFVFYSSRPTWNLAQYRFHLLMEESQTDLP